MPGPVPVMTKRENCFQVSRRIGGEPAIPSTCCRAVDGFRKGLNRSYALNEIIFTMTFDAQITFVPDIQGHVTELTLHRTGTTGTPCGSNRSAESAESALVRTTDSRRTSREVRKVPKGDGGPPTESIRYCLRQTTWQARFNPSSGITDVNESGMMSWPITLSPLR